MKTGSIRKELRLQKNLIFKVVEHFKRNPKSIPDCIQ